MSYPNGAIETAAIARMRGDATLQGLMTGASAPLWNIFDFEGVPTNTPFPYVAAGVPTTGAGTAETMDLESTDSELQVSILTQTGASGGFKQARTIAARVYKLFNRQALDLSASGVSNFFLMFAGSQELEQPDGISQHIPMRFKLMTQG